MWGVVKSELSPNDECRNVRVRTLIITFFYTGLFPVAPGTAGSLAASAGLYALLSFTAPTYSHWQLELLGGLALACLFSVSLGKWAVRHFHRKDPQMFVLDEVAGICVTNLFLPVANWQTIALAFVAFRIFDVTKPPPCRQLEKLPAGWGILCDDLCAGVYANILCQIVVRLALQRYG
jgi:phosphatidylglycerophosphatase A